MDGAGSSSPRPPSWAELEFLDRIGGFRVQRHHGAAAFPGCPAARARLKRLFQEQCRTAGHVPCWTGHLRDAELRSRTGYSRLALHPRRVTARASTSGTLADHLRVGKQEAIGFGDSFAIEHIPDRAVSGSGGVPHRVGKRRAGQPAGPGTHASCSSSVSSMAMCSSSSAVNSLHSSFSSPSGYSPASPRKWSRARRSISSAS